MQQSLFNLGIAGWGFLASNVHFPTLKKMRNVSIPAVAEPNKERHALIKKQVPGAVIYPDLANLLQHPGVSAVLISSPSPVHAAMATKCLEAGVPVYLEKPMSTNLPEGEILYRAWKQAGIIGMTGFNFRFHPAIIELKKKISPVKVRRISAIFTINEKTPGWKKEPEAGGALLDLGSHHIDLLYFLFGSEFHDIRIQTESRTTFNDTVWIRLKINKETEFEGYYAFHESNKDEFRLETDKGEFVFDRIGKGRLELPGFHFPTIKGLQLARILHPGYEPSYGIALSYFIRSVNNGTPFNSVHPSIGDGWHCLKTILQAT